jgi:hypothetical protein
VVPSHCVCLLSLNDPTCCLPPCRAQAVDPACGGNAAATFDEVVSRLARQKAVYKGYSSAREALLLNGRFILQQLAAADAARRGVAAGTKEKDKGKGAAGASEWAFCKGLEAEVGGADVFGVRTDWAEDLGRGVHGSPWRPARCSPTLLPPGKYTCCSPSELCLNLCPRDHLVCPGRAQLAKGPVAVGTLMTAGGGIKIADGAAAADGASAPTDDLMTADEEMARRLQAQMDAQAYGAASGGNRRASPLLRSIWGGLPCGLSQARLEPATTMPCVLAAALRFAICAHLSRPQPRDLRTPVPPTSQGPQQRCGRGQRLHQDLRDRDRRRLPPAQAV